MRDLSTTAYGRARRTRVVSPPPCKGRACSSGLGGTNWQAFAVSSSVTTPITAAFWRLDLAKFDQLLAAIFDYRCVGYSLQLRDRGIVKINQNVGSARKHSDGELKWTADIPMHIASVSKFFTAVALIKILDAHQLAVDALINNWLPAGWQRGPNIEQLTFRHLLSHTSGLITAAGPKVPGGSGIDVMRNVVAAGTQNLKAFVYQNVNYTLCRVLMWQVLNHFGEGQAGTLPREAGLPLAETAFAVDDAQLDSLSISAYEDYLKRNLFDVAGATNASLAPPANGAYAYMFPFVFQHGQQEGGLRGDAGSDGWYMSVSDLLNTLATLRRTNKILAPERFDELLLQGLGTDRWNIDNVDVGVRTDIGVIYSKGGVWSGQDPVYPSSLQQSQLFVLPNKMELAILINSSVGAPEVEVRAEVIEAFKKSLTPYVLIGALARLMAKVRDL